MQKQILEILEKVIKKNYNLEKKDLKLDVPPKKELGDFAFGGFQLARDLKKSPNIIVEDLKTFLEKENNNLIEDLEVAGPYLNIKINKLNIISWIRKYDYKKVEENHKGKTIFIDYIGANVGKPLHIGHMCTPNQGQAMIKVYKKLGFTVVSDSHIGDWGIIFGKLILAYKNWGDENKLKQNAVEHLFELYVKISKEVEKMIKYDFCIQRLKNKIKELNIYKNFSDYRYDYNDSKKLKQIDEKISKLDFDFMIKFKKENNINNLSDLVCEGIQKGDIMLEFWKLSKGNKDSIKLWESFTKESIKAMNKQLSRLKVKPDYNIGESFYEGLGLPKMEDYPDLKWDMKFIVKELIEKKIATANKDGSVGVEFDDNPKIPSCILQKRDGTHGYLASDLAAIKYRVSNWDLETIVYFVDARQQLHLKQAFYIADKAGWLNKEFNNFKFNGEKVDENLSSGVNSSDTTMSSNGKFEEKFFQENLKVGLFHAYNGFISLKDGAMSTRKGKIIKLDKLLDEAEKRAEKIILEKRDDIKGEELKKLSKIIGIGAIKYGYLKKSRETDVVFDWDEFMTFEGNSGPYVQYAYVRARKILEKSGRDFFDLGEDYADVKEKIKQEALNLAKLLLKYNSKDGVLVETIKKNMPHILALYSYELTKSFNSFYSNTEVLTEKNEKLRDLYLKLTKDFSETIKDCFNLLAIDMPEKM